MKEIMKYCKDISVLHENYGHDFQKYESDISYQYSINLCLIQIGELAGKMLNFDGAVEAYPEVEWHNIYGLRNRITHGYGSIDLAITFDVSTMDVPILEKQCEEILERIQGKR